MAATILISLTHFLIFSVLSDIFYPHQVPRRDNTLINGADVQHRTINEP